jgi:translation initiation factor 6 (eIF-6)
VHALATTEDKRHYLEESLHSELEVPLLQFSKMHKNILSENSAQNERQKMLPNLYETSELMTLE